VWAEPYDIHSLTSHVDPRGYLFEILRFKDEDVPGEGQLYTFSIQPGQRRGDHYHLKKREWFTCVFGEALILLTSADGQNQVARLSATEPKVVYAGVGTTHALINTQNMVAVIVSYGSKSHDPLDSDTYKKTAFTEYSVGAETR